MGPGGWGDGCGKTWAGVDGAEIAGDSWVVNGKLRMSPDVGEAPRPSEGGTWLDIRRRLRCISQLCVKIISDHVARCL